MATTLAKFAEELVNLSVKDVQGLLTILKDEYNIEPAAAPVAIAAAAPQEGEGETKEKAEVDIVMSTFDEGRKMELIKLIKNAAEVGLVDAKKLVDASPQPVMKSVPRAKAQEIADSLKQAGATVELK